MSRDLRGALHDWAEHERRAADERTPDTTAVRSGLTRRVARRRAVRTGSTITAALVLVGGVAVGVQALDREPVQPAGPTPTVSPTPTPTPTVEPTPDPTPTETTPVVTSTSVLDALPLPDGIFATTDASWQLVQYEARDEDGTVVAGPSGLYLVAPDGPLYAVPTPTGLLTVLDWLPGTSTVVAGIEGSETVVIDLVTGSTGPALGSWARLAVFAGDGSSDVWVTDGEETDRLTRFRADGTLVTELPGEGTRYYGTQWYPNPGRTVAVRISNSSAIARDLSTLAEVDLPVPYPDEPSACLVRTWADDTWLLLECAAGGSPWSSFQDDNELWLVPVGVDGGAARRLLGLPSTGDVQGVWTMDGDRLVAAVTDGSTLGSVDWWSVTATGAELVSTTEVRGPVVVSARDNRLVVAAPSWEFDQASPWRLVAVDPVTGTVQDLLVGSTQTGGTTVNVFPRGLQRSPDLVGD